MKVFRAIPRGVYILTGVALVAAAATGVFLYSTLQVRYQRDISRIVFNRNWDLLDQVRRDAGVTADSLRRAMADASPVPDADKPDIVVSTAERSLWYKFGATGCNTTR